MQKRFHDVLPKTVRKVSLAVLIAAASFSAVAQSNQSSGTATDAASMQMHKVMNDSHEKSMSMKMTGDADHDFMMMMRSHHEAGIAMAQVEVDNGKDKQMVDMAKKIIAAQKKEVKQLDDWMAKHMKK